MAIGKFQDVLALRGFQPFLWTQFLGALNDNLYKMLVSLAATALLAAEGGGSLLLSAAQGMFILPFILFSGYAGYFADTRSKRKVLIYTKSFELVAMSLALVALATGRIDLMLATLFLMSTQSAFFSPAKYGILPEIFSDRDLTRANALLQMSTFVAIILGTALGGFLYDALPGRLWIVGVVLIIVAGAGAAASLGISETPRQGEAKPFRWNPLGEVAEGIGVLWRDRRMRLTTLGIGYFWYLGALMQIAVLLFGKQQLGVSEFDVSLLVVGFAVGIGVGSMAAGRLSGDKVELGLVPLGAFGMALFCLILSQAAPSYGLSAVCLVGLGVSGGFFIVPLQAFLQQRADASQRGQLLGASGFLTNVGVFLAAVTSWTLMDGAGLAPSQVILCAGFVSIAGMIFAMVIVPEFLIRFLLWLFTHTLYAVRIEGRQRVPFRGPALLVCNHVSFVDGFLVASCIQRFVRFLIYRPYFEMKSVNWILRLMNAIPVAGGDRRKVAESLALARKNLEEGHVVCIFAEGALSRTGNLLPFKRGFERIVKDLDVPIIPVHLDRLWGSIFSFAGGKFLWKRPKKIPYPVTVSFGDPMPSSSTAYEVRQAILELGSEAAALRVRPGDLLHRRFIQQARKRPFSLCLADSSGARMTYGKTLVSALALSRWVRRKAAGQEMVGVLLPAAAGAAVANLAVLLAGKTPVNLNFTAGPEGMGSAIEQCKIQTVLTSRVFLKKGKIEAPPGSVEMESAAKEITSAQKALAALAAIVLPSRLIARLYTPEKRTPASLATVIFSSGSTGTPKGVMLSHRGILANIESVAQVFWVTEQDRMLGVLPFFHCFGFTITLWFPLLSGFPVIYHPNPLDAKTIGKLAEQFKATFLLSTPTFLSNYVRKCSAEQFASLRHVIVGAEKLREPLAASFREKFGLDLLEGYGCTEMAPVVAVNSPGFQSGKNRQTSQKPGTVGHPLPAVATKTVHLETGEPLGPDEAGLLLVKGPNCMEGYLGREDKTREVLQDGWYNTGDVAVLDEDGFIRITDRLSRFSKIGGEMVPHIRIEETVAQLVEDQPCAVTAVPDERKGERLVVLYRHETVTPDELWERLNATELPKLWVPKKDHLFVVEEIPVLGTGKLDLAQVRRLALEMAG